MEGSRAGQDGRKGAIIGRSGAEHYRPPRPPHALTRPHTPAQNTPRPPHSRPRPHRTPHAFLSLLQVSLTTQSSRLTLPHNNPTPAQYPPHAPLTPLISYPHLHAFTLRPGSHHPVVLSSVTSDITPWDGHRVCQESERFFLFLVM